MKTTFKLDLEKTNPPSEFTRDYRVDVILVPVKQLRPYHLQARKIFEEDEIVQLASTIKTHGIRNPLSIAKIDSNLDSAAYEIISGERRWRAAKLLGIERVPCIIVNNNEATQSIALIENIQRKDLSTIELLEGIESYIKNNPTLSREAIMSNLGMSKTSFYRILSLATLTSEVREYALNNPMSINELTQISKVNKEFQFDFLLKLEEQTSVLDSKERSGTRDKKLAGDILESVNNKRIKVIEMRVKAEQIESDTNFSALSKASRINVITILKSFITELEEEGDSN